jgi:preprotein translocase subunit SecG
VSITILILIAIAAFFLSVPITIQSTRGRDLPEGATASSGMVFSSHCTFSAD